MDFDAAKQGASICFSDTYGEARGKFLKAAPASRAYKSSAKGPSGEDLFTDVAYFGATDARRLLVLVSGTHGVEGYCGSAAQLALLQARWHEALPPSTAVLLIHALNCYGFAWDRRVTMEGVDLNRNFIDFAEPLPQNPGYEELAECLVPPDISDRAVHRAEAALAAYQKAHGDLRLRIALSSGQYIQPGGLFYGGTRATESRRTLEQIVADFNVANREEVVILDYHTGLGPYGHAEIQCELSSGREGYERAVKIFGESVTSPVMGTSSAVPIPGTQDAFWQRLMGDRHTYVTPEFGTFQPPRGRLVMRKDCWLFMHRPDAADSEVGRQIRQAVKWHFYPQAADWKEMVIWRSHQVHRQAFQALASAN